MMPAKEKYLADDVDMSPLVIDLNFLLNEYCVNTETIDVLANIEKGTIEKFLDLRDGITYKESCKIYDVIFNLKSVFERLYFTNKNK